MNSELEPIDIFTPEMIDAIANIWSRSVISLIDVRSNQIHPEQPLLGYRMPSSMLIFAYGRLANIQLNHTIYGMERFGVFHGGKGTKLNIIPFEDSILVYKVFYKAEMPVTLKKDFHPTLKHINPFIHLFGYSPGNPIRFKDLFQQMLISWQQTSSLEQLHVKALLYQTIREIYKELHAGGNKVFQPDPVSSTQYYLDEHYTSPILFEDIADMFSISRGQLTKLFKKRTGKSLQEYLTLKRLEKACEQLIQTNATVKEIAGGCGMTEEINLIRLFKKYYRMTPSEFRNKKIVSMHDCDIDNDSQRLYNEKGSGNLIESKRDGEFTMFGSIRNKEMLVAAAMSLMLLLSACGSSTPANTGGSSAVPQQTQKTQAQSNEQAKAAETVAQTRIVTTEKGDVEVSANPTRIVDSGYWRGDILALGVTPIATADFYTKGNAYDEQMSGIKILEKWEAEDIMAMEPDVIITGYEEDFDKFSKIVPTIFIPWATPAEKRIPLIAQVLGLDSSNGEKLIDDYKIKAEEYREKLSKAGVLDKSITVFRYDTPGEMEVFPGYWGSEIVHGLYNMPIPEAANALNDGGYAKVSFEVLPEASGDYILLNIPEGLREELASHTVWNQIPAVQNGNVIMIDPATIFFPDIITQAYKLEYISNALLELAK